MQSVTRKVGKLMNRGPGDNAKVSVLLNDYEDADRVLAKVLLTVLSSALLPTLRFFFPRALLTPLSPKHRSLKTQNHGKNPGTI